MGALTTFPSQGELEREYAGAPDYMRPSRVPYAVCIPGILSDDECDEIERITPYVPPYRAKGCGALTREIEFDPALDPIEAVARNVNNWYFNFDLDPGQTSWMQTYEVGGDYHRHMDGSPGQTRKLTAVALLSDPGTYNGGNLTMFVSPKEYTVPRTRGTIVVFQHWIEHEVTPVVRGTRQTINMGFWGPPFK